MKISRTSRSGRGRQQNCVFILHRVWQIDDSYSPIVNFEVNTLIESQRGSMTAAEALDLAARLQSAARKAISFAPVDEGGAR
jgi:hypothetical protein